MILILLDPDPYHPLFDPDSISSPSSRILILLFIVHSVNFCTGCGRCPSFPQLSAQACGHSSPHPSSTHSGMWQGHPLQPIHPNKCVAEALCHSAWQGRPLPCRYAQACGKSSSSPSSIHTGIWQGRPLPHIPFHIPFHNFFHIFL